jgi:uncharacterized protein YqeY
MDETTLSETQLRQDLHDAMKRRETVTVSVLRGVLAAVGNRRIELGGEVPPAELVSLVRREAKKREEAEEFARKAGRAELVEQNAAERTVLARYLPVMLSDDALTALVEGWIAEGAHDLKSLMARLKERHPGQYEGKRASEIVRSLLAAR